jgi:putative ATPase
VLLFGPPGTGKTTVASLISRATGRRFEALSALSAGVKDVRAVIDAARRRAAAGQQTVLFIDEVHRFSKTQQDALLAAVENRTVLLVGATTENPSFSVVSPLLSRSLVLSLRPLGDDDIRLLIERARTDPRGLSGEWSIESDALEHLVRIANGDARRALTALEAAADAADPTVITVGSVEAAVDTAIVRYDRNGDQHYDVISAFIKSLRGSDVDAALHYLARMITAGEDPRFIARRLMVHASEDIGMADPTALHTATAAASAVAMIGMPEAELALAQATIHLATAPKSGAVVAAIDAAKSDVAAGKVGVVPPHLRDGHYRGAERLRRAEADAGEWVRTYRYPHDSPEGVLAQQYPPDNLVGTDYYHPTDHGFEHEVGLRVESFRRIVRGT